MESDMKKIKKTAKKNTAEKTPARKAITKKAPARKAIAKKAPAGKVAAKKVLAKKTTAKATPAKKIMVSKAPKYLVRKPRHTEEKQGKAAPIKKIQPAEPLTKHEVAEIAASLSEMKNEIAKNVEDKKTLDILEPEVGDSIDHATQSLDKEILFELSDNERKILHDIEAALRKMEKGTYGLCEHCKSVIEKKRIKALPSARYCMICQSGAEKNRG
ncbi:MAG: hypothetical protein COX65_00670 [Elusimicrobia bacterium CG_4_10_14_0_2_um_filter_56_8]|nr:MAG: hypothetical protein COX65_00670 [Elusimicrobia bacterium CG_4_10_14_0_2_um_filter_56_8]